MFLSLLLAITIYTSGEQRFSAAGNFDVCPDKLVMKWGSREREKETTYILDETHCRKYLLVTHTFTDRSPRRIKMIFYDGEDILGESYLDVNFR